MAAPAAAVRNTQAVTVRPEHDALVAFQRELDRRRDAIETSASSLVDPDRYLGIVLSTFTRTPGLWECDPVTVARAVVEAAQLGLEPTGLMGGAYLVPFYNGKTRQKECQLIVGYRGLADLARRSGEVEIVQAEVVREQDDFEWEKGLHERLVHVPRLSGDRGLMTHVYAIARYRSGNAQFDVMDAVEIELIKGRSKSRDRDGNLVGPWVTDFFEMAKKTVVRRLAKLLPLTIEARQAIESEDAFEGEARAARPAPTRALPRSRIAARLAEGSAIADPIAEPASAVTPPAGDSVISSTAAPVPDGPDLLPASEGGAVADASPSAPIPVVEHEGQSLGRCTGFEPTLGRCVREPDHAGNHRTSQGETWK